MLATDIVLIAHNLRSAHNIGSLLRTADGLGVSKVYLTGYTPYPTAPHDSRLPHMQLKITNHIHKTALGAEKSQAWEHNSDIIHLLENLQSDGYQLIALEQAPTSVPLPDFKVASKVALVVGNEVEGLENDVLNSCQTIVEIPMKGQKESFNVVQAAAMALYHFKYGAWAIGASSIISYNKP